MSAEQTAWRERYGADHNNLLISIAAGLIPERLHWGVDVHVEFEPSDLVYLWWDAYWSRSKSVHVPRRLVWTYPNETHGPDAVTPVALSLLNLHPEDLCVSSYWGEKGDDREWMRRPDTPAVIVQNRDWVGRALSFRGRGMSREDAPTAAGMLGTDVWHVVHSAWPGTSHPYLSFLKSVVEERRREGGLFPGSMVITELASLI